MGGHAVAGRAVAIGLAATIVHLAAMAIWLGALVVAVVVVDRQRLIPVAARLSPIALGAVIALAVTGEALSPLYRDGDILIVSPTASPRKGDRIVVCTTSGEILAKELKRRSANTLTMTSLAKDEDQVISAEEIAWIARIMWARW